MIPGKYCGDSLQPYSAAALATDRLRLIPPRAGIKPDQETPTDVLDEFVLAVGSLTRTLG